MQVGTEEFAPSKRHKNCPGSDCTFAVRRPRRGMRRLFEVRVATFHAVRGRLRAIEAVPCGCGPLMESKYRRPMEA